MFGFANYHVFTKFEKCWSQPSPLYFTDRLEMPVPFTICIIFNTRYHLHNIFCFFFLFYQISVEFVPRIKQHMWICLTKFKQTSVHEVNSIEIHYPTNEKTVMEMLQVKILVDCFWVPLLWFIDMHLNFGAHYGPRQMRKPPIRWALVFKASMPLGPGKATLSHARQFLVVPQGHTCACYSFLPYLTYSNTIAKSRVKNHNHQKTQCLFNHIH